MALRYLALTMATGALLAAQDNQADRVAIPFRDATKPRTLNVTLINGGVTVRGYSGADAIIEGSGRGPQPRSSRAPAGMHRIDDIGLGLDVNENNNVVTVRGGLGRPVDLTIQVPVETSLKLKTLNGGSIVVENINGEIEAENMNGAVTITGVSGSVVANSMNGRITVSLDKATPGKSMSFSTMNGTIDVTLPADIKARLKMKTDNGEIFIDDGLDVKVASGSAPVVDDQRGHGGRYRVRLDHTTYGDINGGGPEVQFVTYNGTIMIHKK
jgi:hypothetical protein